METTSIPSEWQPESASSQAPPIEPTQLAGLELHQLWRFIPVVAILGLSLLLSAWSRIELRELAVLLDQARKQHNVQLTEHIRLSLEMASLSDPIRLAGVSETLQLTNDVTVIDITTAQPPR